jgi:hypothetical protein
LRLFVDLYSAHNLRDDGGINRNIYAIAKTIEALRGIERWGSGSMVEQAFTGFVTLPAPKSPWEVIGVPRGASSEEIEAAFRAKAKKR